MLAHTLSGLIITLQASTVQAEKEHASAELVARLQTASELAKDGLADARAAVAALTHTPPASESWDRWLDRTVTRVAAAASVDIRSSGDSTDGPPRLDRPGPLDDPGGADQLATTRRRLPVRLVFDPTYVEVTSIGDPAMFEGRGHRGSGQGLSGLERRADDRGAVLTRGPTATGFVLRLSWAGRS